MDSPLALAGLESMAAMALQAWLVNSLGCRVPFEHLLSWSIDQLADHLAAQIHFGPAPSATAAPPPAGAAALALAQPDGAVSAGSSAASPDVAAADAAAPVEADGALAPFAMSPLQRSYMMGRELEHGAWLYWENDVGRRPRLPAR